VNALSRWIACRLLARMAVGSLVIVEGETRITFGAGTPSATIDVHAPEFWPLLLFRGSRGLADAYARGLFDSPDLVAVVRLAARNAHRLDHVRSRLAPLRWPLQRARAALTRNTRARSRRGIEAHYDLGNDLFSRMLDPTMSYSCAVFDDDAATLEQASLRKLELVCEKLKLGPGDRVLEIGAGWGAFAIYAASTRGCHVTTTTISAEQYEHVLQIVHTLKLEDRVRVLNQDYRDLRGRYDKLVSIEMIEAVGWQHIGTFLKRCSDLLESDGAMLLQAITIDDRGYEVQKAARSFMNTHIFPGGCLPSLAVLTDRLARCTDMQTADLHDITRHYVPTLRVWRETFLAHADELDALGYDAAFRKLWTLYLAYCEAGFAERRICDIQLLLVKPRCRLVEGDAIAARPAISSHREILRSRVS
jgi:cyclopropane-fatty-acyl-phospholipid synthase